MNNQTEQFQEICNSVILHAIDCIGCPEINLDTTQQPVKSTLKNSLSAAFNHALLQISCLLIPAKYFLKLGGTMCITQ
eukprot:14933669-Ditylum_brightwellii.AAC.1